MTVKVSIDSTRGHALCLGVAPDAFGLLDFENRSVVRAGAAQVPVDVLPAAARDRARVSGRRCAG